MDYNNDDCRKNPPPEENAFECEECDHTYSIECLSKDLAKGMICINCKLKPLDSYMQEDR